MAQLKTGTTIGGNVAWHAGNDGPGSGLDADMVDGLHASSFSGATVQAAAPTPNRVGQLWIDSDDLILAETDWIALPFINGWTNYDTGGTWAVARYARLYGNVGYMEGLIKGTNNTACAVLPAGFRPGYDQHRATCCDPNGTGTIHLNASGAVIPYSPTGNPASWISIHMSWFIDQ